MHLILSEPRFLLNWSLGCFAQLMMSVFSSDVEENGRQHNDLKWVWLAQKDPNRFSHLYHQHHEKIFRYIFKRTMDYDLTDELTAQTFVKAYSKLHTFKDQGFPFSSWLFKIATNELNQHFRKRKNACRHVAIEEVKAKELIEENFEDSEETLLKLSKCMEALSPEEIQLIEWRFFEERSFKEIAYLLEITEANAKVKTYRLIGKIKSMMQNLK